MKYLILLLTSIVYSLSICEGYSINSTEICETEVSTKYKYEQVDTLAAAQDTSKGLSNAGRIGVDMGSIELPSGSYGLVSMILSYDIMIEKNILFYSTYRNYILLDYSFYSFAMGLGGCGEQLCSGIGISLIKQGDEWTNGVNAVASYQLFKHLELTFTATIIDWVLPDEHQMVTDIRGGIAYIF